MALIPTLFLPGGIPVSQVGRWFAMAASKSATLNPKHPLFALMPNFALFLPRAPVSATKPKKNEKFEGATGRCIFMHQGISLNPTDQTTKQSTTTAEVFPRHSSHLSLSTAATKQL